jgi:hypothetical protein
MKRLLLFLTAVISLSCAAQNAFDFITKNRNFSASNYCIYPDSIQPQMTPPPAGKQPFYISHYGRHGSRYLSNRKGYDIPYNMLCKADSMNQLTPIGKDVLHDLRQIIEDSEGRWGDLTELGKRQHRHIARRMSERFPEVFRDSAFIDARSTTANRCILSMGSAVAQLAALHPRLAISLHASKQDAWYLNYQDQQLRDSMKSRRGYQVFAHFCQSREQNPRLMNLLFINPDTVSQMISTPWLNYYLLKTALIQQNTGMSERTRLIDLFTYEEIHRFWQNENAWWYIMHGPSPFTSGHQHYTQRKLLRKMIEDADSIIRTDRRGAHLRFGHETVILPLVCLLGLNGFDFVTDDLEQLEPNGWWASLVFPMASNVQFVFYRQDAQDEDVIFKVLLNEQEAKLPIPTDIAPYYHWRDFRQHYLQKIEDYELLRAASAR